MTGTDRVQLRDRILINFTHLCSLGPSKDVSMSSLVVSDRLGKQWTYVSVVLWHTYCLTRLAADVVHAQTSGFRFGFDMTLAAVFTVLWIVVMTRRLVGLRISRWWALPYGLLMLTLAFGLKRANALEITIAVIVWFALQLPIMLRRPRKISGSAT